MLSDGAYMVVLVFLSALGNDTLAYCAGRLFGKHKMSPRLSPKKTIEGAVGGVVWATAAAVVFGIIAEKYFTLDQAATGPICAIIGVFGSIMSQIGDLAASSFKRMVGIKDYGNLIPGHGGILDRFDSVLFTAPVVYYVMLFSIKIF